MPEDEKYEVLEKIGHGSFGIIRKVKRKSDGYVLCRKEISYSKMSQKEREQLQAELSILKELVHPNIVRYYEREHLKASQDLHLYMEYCGNGDLGRVIQNLKNKNQIAKEEFVWSIFSQIVSALYRCHNGQDAPAPGQDVMGLGADAKQVRDRSRPMILHRDLKPENIFLDHDNSVKLGDFGLSKILQSHDFASTYVGTPFYMSPEICKAEQYGPHSDIWALGCIIYEMCAKAPPFNAKTHFELIQKIKAGRYPALPSCYSPELNKVIASCLQVFPNNRPDTAQLLNLPIVKLMRKEQEVVILGQEVKRQQERLAEKEKSLHKDRQELDDIMVLREKELSDRLRREWEVKARLMIDERVTLEVERRTQEEFEKLQRRFDEEVNAQVERALRKYPARPSTSPKLAPRSNTPTMPAAGEQSILFPSETDMAPLSTSVSTLDTNSSFASGTDISSLSLDDAEENTKTIKPTVKKRTRAPLARAQTMANPMIAPPSPMDIQMMECSPAPASLAGLSLSPRRNQPRQNIFAAAREGAKRWEGEVPPSPTENDWNGDLADDNIPSIPSPTRARSASGGRSNRNDPFKSLAAAQKPILKPSNRLASTPTLAPTGATKPRPHSAVPVIATSPSRKNLRLPADSTSPVRKAKSSELSMLKSKKGNFDDVVRMQPLRANNNTNGVPMLQGRSILDLQQARGIPAQALSEDEGRRGIGMRAGFRSPIKGRNAVAAAAAAAAGLGKEAAIWDPETVDGEMPSPFIVRSKRMVK